MMFCVVAATEAAPIISITQWIGPSGGTASDTASANAIQGMLTGVSSYGTPNTPEYYQATSGSVSAKELIYCMSFGCWDGVADPTAVFGQNFAGQAGNLLHYGAIIQGNGSTISPSFLTFSATSTGSSPIGEGVSFLGFSPTVEGINYGADGYLGASTNTFVTSGSSLVDAIVLGGVGLADGVASCSLCTTTAQQQNALDMAAAGIYGTVTGTYLYNSQPIGAMSTQLVQPATVQVPEPPSLLLLVLCLVGVIAVRRRNTRNTQAPDS